MMPKRIFKTFYSSLLALNCFIEKTHLRNFLEAFSLKSVFNCIAPSIQWTDHQDSNKREDVASYANYVKELNKIKKMSEKEQPKQRAKENAIQLGQECR